jgi:hypothetical protein
MARQTLTKSNAPGSYATAGVVVTMTAADTVNKEQIASTGKELVIAHNTGGSPYTVTINSAADEYGRTGDITAYSIAAGAIAVFGPFPVHGWRQTNNYINLEANNIAVKFGVIVLP